MPKQFTSQAENKQIYALERELQEKNLLLKTTVAKLKAVQTQVMGVLETVWAEIDEKYDDVGCFDDSTMK